MAANRPRPNKGSKSRQSASEPPKKSFPIVPVVFVAIGAILVAAIVFTGGESDTGLSFNPGNTLFSLRQRTRDYDGRGPRLDAPGVQLAFRVSPEEVDECYEKLVARGVEIAEPPTDQPRGHRTLYFFDPEHNLLEIYAEI